MRKREVATRSFDGMGDLVVVAPLRDGFIDAYETVTFETRARMAAEALHNIRLNAREYEIALPFSDTTERILNVLDFRLGVIDKNLYEIDQSMAEKSDPAPVRARRYLFLTVTFDSGWEPYMRLIWKPLGAFLDLFFCNCEGYITAGDHGFEEYIRWVRAAQVESSIFYAATSFGVADMLWFKEADRIITDPAKKDVRDAQLADLTVKSPIDLAKEFRSKNENLRKSLQVGLEALNVLYKLGDLYPLHQLNTRANEYSEGRHLARATHELLNGFDIILEKIRLGAPPMWEAIRNKSYKEPLDWWDKGKSVLVSQAPTPPDPQLVRSEIQAGILSPILLDGKAADVGALLLMTITNPAEAQAFINALPIRYEGGSGTDSYALSIAFTAQGLKSMGMYSSTLDRWPKEFRDGMALRSGIVGDKREHHPRNWKLPLRSSPLDSHDGKDAPRVAISEIDFVLQIRMLGSADGSDQPLLNVIQSIISGENTGVTIAAWERMAKGGQQGSDARVDHFGFRDGLSQPIATEDLPKLDAEVAETENTDVYQDEVRLGELLLGYSNDRGDAANCEEYLFNSTFLIIRKIEQNVGVLEKWASETCVSLNHDHGLTGQINALTPDRLKSYLVGRSQDGTPLIPGASDNRFDYRSDPGGLQCPLASHIRRTNPRTETFGRPTPRILRRGMSFGPPVGSDAENPLRGIIFMGYVASIAEQYEVIQRWVNGGNSTGIPSTHNDPLLGVAPAKGDRHFQFYHAGKLMQCSIPATRIRDALLPNSPKQDSFTRLHWGTYLWVPSKTALEQICAFDLRHVDFDEPLENTGLALIQRLEKLPPSIRDMEWKRLLEDFDSKDPTERYLSPDVWSAIRFHYGGAYRVERARGKPPLVLIGREKLGNYILSNPTLFSSSEQTRRMHDSFGLNYVTIDGGPDYETQSGVTNAIMYAQTSDEGFTVAHKYASAVIRAILAPAIAAGMPQARFDIRRQFLMPTLGLICKEWFGLPGSSFMDLGGLDFDPNRTKARCPGDFISSSRYIFNPEPSTTLEAIGKKHGRMIRDASLAFVNQFRGRDDIPGTLARHMFQAIPNDNDLLARNLSGMMLGMLAPIEASLRGILFEWLSEQTLWRHQAAYLKVRTAGQPNYTEAKAALHDPIVKAMCKRPAPDSLYRTATGEHIFDVSSRSGDNQKLTVQEGDLVVVSLASISQRLLGKGQPDTAIVFGGERRPIPTGCPYPSWPPADQDPQLPLHACPARKLMTGAITGIIAALFDSGRIQAMPAGLVIGIDTGNEAVMDI